MRQHASKRNGLAFVLRMLLAMVLLVSAMDGASAAPSRLMPVPGQAYIVVTPFHGEATLFYPEYFPNGGWDVPFTFENVSDVPFRVDRIEGFWYAGDSLEGHGVVTTEWLLQHMSSEWMRKGDRPLEWPFATDQLHMTHFECVIYGTDANGNELSFRGRVEYLLPEGE